MAGKTKSSFQKMSFWFYLLELGYLKIVAPLAISLDFILTQRDWPGGFTLWSDSQGMKVCDLVQPQAAASFIS